MKEEIFDTLKRALERLFLLLLRFYLKIFVFVIDKYAILKRRWELRKAIKIIEAHGGKVRIKNNKYVGGTDVEIELPLKE